MRKDKKPLSWSVFVSGLYKDVIEGKLLASAHTFPGAPGQLRPYQASFTIPLVLLMLNLIGYVPNAAVQTPRTVNAFRFLIGRYMMALSC
jgi:hypothetical protein